MPSVPPRAACNVRIGTGPFLQHACVREHVCVCFCARTRARARVSELSLCECAYVRVCVCVWMCISASVRLCVPVGVRPHELCLSKPLVGLWLRCTCGRRRRRLNLQELCSRWHAVAGTEQGKTAQPLWSSSARMVRWVSCTGHAGEIKGRSLCAHLICSTECLAEFSP